MEEDSGGMRVSFRRSESKGQINAIAHPWRRKVAELCKSSRVELLLGLIICSNMVVVILETDATADNLLAPLWMRAANLVFLAVYTIEAAVKIYAWRWKYFHDSWNLLDFTVVLLDMALTITALFQLSGSGVSMLRIFRMGKMVRIFRVLRQIWELKILLMSFAAAAKSIVFGMVMVLIMMTSWSVLAVQFLHPINKELWLDSDCERCGRAFSTVWEAQITIFQTVMMGDGWGTLAIPLIERASWASTYFLFVYISLQLAMLNLILAVIVERAASAKELDLHQQAVAKEEEMIAAKESLLQLCRLMDKDKSGSLDLEEIKDGFNNNPKFASSLVSMGVFLEDVDLLFEVLDVEGTGAVPYVELVDTLARLKSQISYVILFQLTAIQKHMRDLRAQRARSEEEDELGINKAASSASKGSAAPPAGQAESASFRRLVDSKFTDMMRETNQRFDQILHEISRSFDQAQRIAEKADSRPHERPTTVFEALTQECSPEAMRLLREDTVVGLNERTKSGDTTLIRAIKNQMWEVVFEILRHEEFTQLNETDGMGLSAWHHALVRERSDVVAAITNRPDFAAVHKLDLNAVAQHVASARASKRAVPVVGI
ncbi:Catsper1 [Symbiodinium natans]|uniref:Catsper1 protein n=1 Tax=Symbiodinium natans TaxID=878477 RepID=A0A812NXX0_9DINO|nr:Catsper1 [Symbiodinium natans]